jgi:hypothetical protein
MIVRLPTRVLGWAMAVVLVACDDQFDFDTQGTDGGSETGQAAPEAGQDTGDAPETGPDSGGSVGRIACGASSCVRPNRACCVRSATLACIEPLEVDCVGLLIHCDSASDCRAGSVCCATLVDGGISSVQCELSSDCASADQLVLCDPTDPNDCPRCESASALLPAGYHTCR